MNFTKVNNNKINVSTFIVLLILMLGVHTNSYSQRFMQPERISYTEYNEFIDFLNQPYEDCFSLSEGEVYDNWDVYYSKRNKKIVWERVDNDYTEIHLQFTKGICTAVIFYDAKTYQGWLNDLTTLEKIKNGKSDYDLLRIPNDSEHSKEGKVIDVIFKQEPVMYGGTAFTTYFYLLDNGKNKDLKKMKKQLGFRK